MHHTKAKQRSGTLAATITIENLRWNTSWINNEIPVTPPSRNLLGIKNPLNAKPHITDPHNINKRSRTLK
jgi:hypothetical protein